MRPLRIQELSAECIRSNTPLIFCNYADAAGVAFHSDTIIFLLCTDLLIGSVQCAVHINVDSISIHIAEVPYGDSNVFAGPLNVLDLFYFAGRRLRTNRLFFNWGRQIR